MAEHPNITAVFGPTPSDRRFANFPNPITAAAHRGAQFLDTAVPDWFRPSCATPIDISMFNISSFSHCILGQLCQLPRMSNETSSRMWESAIRRRFPTHAAIRDMSSLDLYEWLMHHGFYPMDTTDPGTWHRNIQPAWVDEIERRRAAVPPAPPADNSSSKAPRRRP